MNKFDSRFCCLLIAISGVATVPVHAGLIFVDFGSGSFQNLPYQEDGFTFSQLSGSAFLNGTSDRYLAINLPNGPTTTGARMTSSTPFDLQSFRTEGTTSRNWEVTSSSGGLLTISHGTGPSLFTLPTTNAWQNLTYVDFIHDEGAANAAINLDNFNMISPTATPEPSSVACLAIGFTVMIGWSKLRKSRS